MFERFDPVLQLAHRLSEFFDLLSQGAQGLIVRADRGRLPDAQQDRRPQ
jgi:hypothetical protein